MDEWMDGCAVGEWMHGGMEGWVSGWMYGWVDGWMYGSVDRQTYRWTDRQRDRDINKHVGPHVCIVGTCMYVCM